MVSERVPRTDKKLARAISPFIARPFSPLRDLDEAICPLTLLSDHNQVRPLAILHVHSPCKND